MGLLHLNLKGEYFDEIKAGTKTEEYRLYNEFWRKRLLLRQYDGILIKRGYPKKDDASRIIRRPWKGCRITTITHKNFGDKPVRVFAIDVSGGAL